MNKEISIVILAIGIMVLTCVLVFASDERFPPGPGVRIPLPELLTQLPAEKEMLFHQTMREVRERTAGIREKLRKTETEIKGILTAKEFNETLFREKTKTMQELHNQMREAMEEAIVKLAQRFTAEERKILAELTPPHGNHHPHFPAGR